MGDREFLHLGTLGRGLRTPARGASSTSKSPANHAELQPRNGKTPTRTPSPRVRSSQTQSRDPDHMSGFSQKEGGDHDGRRPPNGIQITPHQLAPATSGRSTYVSALKHL